MAYTAQPIKKATSKVRSVDNTDFTKVNIKGRFDVLIEKGEQYKIEITGPTEQIAEMDIEQVSDLLVLTAKGNSDRYRPKLYITSPSLSQVSLNNAENAKIIGFEEERFMLKNEGNNRIRAFIKADQLDLILDGRREADIAGEVDRLTLLMDDDPILDASGLEAGVARIEADDFREAKLFVTDTLRYDVSNRSRLEVQGNPVEIDERRSQNE